MVRITLIHRLAVLSMMLVYLFGSHRRNDVDTPRENGHVPLVNISTEFDREGLPFLPQPPKTSQDLSGNSEDLHSPPPNVPLFGNKTGSYAVSELIHSNQRRDSKIHNSDVANCTWPETETYYCLPVYPRAIALVQQELQLQDHKSKKNPKDVAGTKWENNKSVAEYSVGVSLCVPISPMTYSNVLVKASKDFVLSLAGGIALLLVFPLMRVPYFRLVFRDNMKTYQNFQRPYKKSQGFCDAFGDVLQVVKRNSFSSLTISLVAMSLVACTVCGTEPANLRDKIMMGEEPCIRFVAHTKTFELTCTLKWKLQSPKPWVKDRDYDGENHISLGANETFDGQGEDRNGRFVIDLTGITSFRGLFTVTDDVTTFDEAPVIRNVHVINGETDASYHGGFIVQDNQRFFVVDSCSSTGIINGGGICGRRCGGNNGQIMISNSYSTGMILYGTAGGIAGQQLGFNEGTVNITGCFSTGSIEGNLAGGIAGNVAGAQGGRVFIIQCHSTGNLAVNALGTGGATSGGGIIGNGAAYTNGYVLIQQCYSTGKISPKSSGGIAGGSIAIGDGRVDIIDCYTRGAIEGEYAGGIWGGEMSEATGTVHITNTYASGAIGHANAGGLLGKFSVDFTGNVEMAHSVYNFSCSYNEQRIVGWDPPWDPHLEDISAIGVSGCLRNIRGELYHHEGVLQWDNKTWALNGTQGLPILRFQIPPSPSPSPSPSITSTVSSSPSITATVSSSPSLTPTTSSTPSNTDTPSPSMTATGSLTPTPTRSVTNSATGTHTSAVTPTCSATTSATPSTTATLSATSTTTKSSLVTPTQTTGMNISPTATHTCVGTPTATITVSSTATHTSSGTPSRTATKTIRSTATSTFSRTPMRTTAITASGSKPIASEMASSASAAVHSTAFASSVPAETPGDTENQQDDDDDTAVELDDDGNDDASAGNGPNLDKSSSDTPTVPIVASAVAVVTVVILVVGIRYFRSKRVPKLSQRYVAEEGEIHSSVNPISTVEQGNSFSGAITSKHV